jgi:hypothetical protein
VTVEQSRFSPLVEYPDQSGQRKPMHERLYIESRGVRTVEAAQHRWHARCHGSIIRMRSGLEWERETYGASDYGYYRIFHS